MSTETLQPPAATARVVTAAQPSVSAMRIALFPARAFLALGWFRAGVEKVISTNWWTGEELTSFIADHEGAALPITSLLEGAFLPPVAVLLSVIVMAAEFMIAIALLTTRRLRPALIAACALNVAFVAFGAVTPSVFYLVLQLTLLFGTQSAIERSRHHPALIAGCLGIVLIMLPMISTLHPAEVIEDPAIMLATLAMLAAATMGFEAFALQTN